MSGQGSLKEDSQAVHVHLEITQSVVQRMASNSASCKTWCITLVSAILVIVAEKGNSRYGFVALIPTLCFCGLDTYYLSLERMFRISYNEFVEKLHEGKLGATDLYAVAPSGKLLQTFVAACRSYSIWPFYGMLFLVVMIAVWLIN